MTLIETLNRIGIACDAMSITFTAPMGEEDLDADSAREAVVHYLVSQGSDETHDWQENERTAPDVHERFKQLCIYGAKLFAAIDAFETSLSTSNHHNQNG